MRTIYLVNGHNDMMYEDFRWWNIQAFASKEDAERFISEKKEEYLKDETRIYELEDKWDAGIITDEEKDELTTLQNKWNYITCHEGPEHEWYITEIKFQE